MGDLKCNFQKGSLISSRKYLEKKRESGSRDKGFPLCKLSAVWKKKKRRHCFNSSSSTNGRSRGGNVWGKSPAWFWFLKKRKNKVMRYLQEKVARVFVHSQFQPSVSALPACLDLRGGGGEGSLTCQMRKADLRLGAETLRRQLINLTAGFRSRSLGWNEKCVSISRPWVWREVGGCLQKLKGEASSAVFFWGE